MSETQSLTIDEQRDAMWRARISATLALHTDPLYEGTTNSTKGRRGYIGGGGTNDDVDEIDQLQSCFVIRLRGNKDTPPSKKTPRSHQTTSGIDADEREAAEFPICFYAHMLGNNPTYHESISACNTPRHKPRSQELDASGDEASFRYFGSKIASNIRNKKYGPAGVAEGIYPSALIEHCDASVIVKAQQCAAEINDLIKHVGRRNQVCEAARVQLMRSRCVSQTVVGCGTTATTDPTN